MNIPLPKEIIKALHLLQNNGFSAFIVGGCVRDFLLNNIPTDYDITTNAKPDDIIHCFLEYKTIETGKKHGTITVIINDYPIEITTFRIDGIYTDNRHPASVTYTSDILQDLSRRDFTVNAIAYHPQKGFVDYFNGMDDIKTKTLRLVGNSEKRLEEDALRIMRAIRFSSTLEFKIDENTHHAIKSKKHLLKNVSAERINNEFSKLLLGSNVATVLEEYFDVLQIFIPELKNVNVKTVANAISHSQNDLTIRLAILLHQIPNYYDILKRLRYDNQTISIVSDLITLNQTPINIEKSAIKRLLNNYSITTFKKFLNLKNAMDPNSLQFFAELSALLLEIEQNEECYTLKQLKINGHDLKEVGILNGSEIGYYLNQALELVIQDHTKNDKNYLLEQIMKK